MDDASRHRRRGRHSVARRTATLAMSACLCMSCTGDQNGETGTDAPAGELATSAGANRTAATPPSPDGRVGLPRMPTTRDAAALARQLERAAATLRDRDAPVADVRESAEFQQLAVHALATASETVRGQVTAQLDPGTARPVRSDVAAAGSLRALTSPAKTLPPWRIVAPPPAAELLGYYHEAQRRSRVPWTYLAAIHLVETRMGRIRGTSTAGARGPMQFIPSTWELYGAGGDINDPRNAILAAARLLEDNGAPGDMAAALRAYNPSDHYVRAVTEHARTMQRSRTAYRGYWHWRVLYRHTRGTYVLPIGYPDNRPVLLPG